MKLGNSKKQKHLKMIVEKMQLDLSAFNSEKDLLLFLDKQKSEDLIKYGLDRFNVRLSRSYQKYQWITYECPFAGIYDFEQFDTLTVKRWCNRENTQTYKEFRNSLFNPESDNEMSFSKSDLCKSIIKNHLQRWDKIYL